MNMNNKLVFSDILTIRDISIYLQDLAFDKRIKPVDLMRASDDLNLIYEKLMGGLDFGEKPKNNITNVSNKYKAEQDLNGRWWVISNNFKVVRCCGEKNAINIAKLLNNLWENENN